MAKEWIVRCKNCGQEFGYSDWSYQAGAARGQSRPERCPECRRVHTRQTALMGLAYFDLQPRANADTATIHPGALGMLSHPAREHQATVLESSFDPTQFGITDEDVRALFHWLQPPEHQVAVVVGSTGTNKSTVLPFRLIHPPAGVPQDQLTRHGQVVVTQPRIQATRNIPAYVAKVLYGSNLGSGFDIGFRYSNHPYSDWRNRLVYVTDGTLINWIVTGQISNLSAIMIDEAHERSLNIDLILGLLKKLLPRYPHLKLIIASATIDSSLFVQYFGAQQTALIEFQGQRKHNVATIYAADAERQPYEEVIKLRRGIPDAVAHKVIWLLDQIVSGKKEAGDILGFLQGERPIERAVALIRQALENHAQLAGQVDVYPLYTTLPQEEQNKALLPKLDPSRRRVVITTNVAETSLTVGGIVYVVDSGLINEAQWDSRSETKQVSTVLHSQAGCKQRWGRAGRICDGEAYVLYTKEQFEKLFRPFTVPQIQRSPLEQIVLTAKAAGIDDLAQFDWIEQPPIAELERAPNSLRKMGALDAQGDLTEHGLELQAFAEEPLLANLLALADRFSCTIEVATLLPMIKLGGLRYLLRWDRRWDATTRRAVGQIHAALRQGCRDDLEFCLKLYAAWSEGQFAGLALVPEWAMHQVWPRYLPAFPPPLKDALGERAPAFREAAQAEIHAAGWEACVRRFGLSDVAEPWLAEAGAARERAARDAWGRAFFVNHSLLKTKIEPERELLLDALSGHKKEEERRPIDFELLDRVRVVLAYCLPDRHYRAVGAGSAAGSETETVYQLRSPAGTPAASQTELIVQNDSDSVCYAREIPAFVCAKQQILTHRPAPHLPPAPVLHVSYLAQVDPRWLPWLDQEAQSPLALGRFFATTLRNPTTGLLPNQAAGERLFLDQLLPLGSRYSCRVVQIRPDGTVYVALGPRMRDPHRIVESYRSEEPDDIRLADNLDDMESAPGDFVDTVLTADDAPVADPEEEVPPPWADLADDSWEIDAPLPPVDTGSAPISTSRALPTVLAYLAPAEDTYQIGEGLLAEVAGYVFGNPLGVMLQPVPAREPWDAFVERYPAGQEALVEVTGYDAHPGDGHTALIVREPHSRLELLLEPEQLSFTRRGVAVKEIPIGTQFLAYVERVDRASQRVYLSCLAFVEAQIEEIVRQARRTDQVFEATGIVREISLDRLYLTLDWSDPPRGLVHVVTVGGRGLYKALDAYQVGESCRVRLRFFDRPVHQALSALPDAVKARLGTERIFQNLSWDQGMLYYAGRMPYTLRQALLMYSDDPAYRRAIADLYFASHQFLAETIDVDWCARVSAKYPVGTWVAQARIAHLAEYGAFVELEPGLQGLLHRSEMAQGRGELTDDTLVLGQPIRVRISKIDCGRGKIALSTREDLTGAPRADRPLPPDPPLLVQVGQQYRGRVTNVKPFGAFVEIAPGISGLVHVSKLLWDPVSDATRVVQVGEEPTVIVIDVDRSEEHTSE